MGAIELINSPFNNLSNQKELRQLYITHHSEDAEGRSLKITKLFTASENP